MQQAVEKKIEVPHVIKYMGSKRNILDFVTECILENKSHGGQKVYDLFGGSAVVSGALREKGPVCCNDIQAYTSVLGKLYLNNYHWEDWSEDIAKQIVEKATSKVERFRDKYSHFVFSYSADMSFEEAVSVESAQQKLLTHTFNGLPHLFVQNYSGTYWSFEQCVWIDAIASVANEKPYKESFLYPVILGSLMFAMAYCSQSTGHYAQYRGLTKDNMQDVLFYRRKEILPLFEQKFEALKGHFNGASNTDFNHEVSTTGFLEAIENSEAGSLYYADPPYQFVHYSRFYHALETLTRYDYPEVRFKGRYRQDRHQSPFCIRTQVKKAFDQMFKAIYAKEGTLVLSYSNSGMITYDEIIALASNRFKNYTIESEELDYEHSTMGRQGDKSREVKEYLIVCRPLL